MFSYPEIKYYLGITYHHEVRNHLGIKNYLEITKNNLGIKYYLGIRKCHGLKVIMRLKKEEEYKFRDGTYGPPY